MKILILITTYNRPESLLNLLKDIKNDDLRNDIHLLIYNDGSTENYFNVISFLHQHFPGNCSYYDTEVNGGKENYWQLINEAYKEVKHHDFDYFIQFPDDVRLIDNSLSKATTAFS